MSSIVRFTDHRAAAPSGKRHPAPIHFDRRDLERLLALYAQRVATGEWRDYAIGSLPGMACFSMFRHSHENAQFTVTKRMVSGKALYAVFAGERKLRQGGKLPDVLAVFEKPLRLISG